MLIGYLKIGYAKDSVTKALRTNLFIVIAGTVAAILLFSIGVILLVRGITRPLQQCVEITEKLSQGELDIDITDSGNDEVGRLLASMKIMVEKIREVVADVKTAGDNVAGGSQQISSGSVVSPRVPLSRRFRSRPFPHRWRRWYRTSGRMLPTPCRQRR